MVRRSPLEAYWVLSLFVFLLVCSSVEGANWLRVGEVKGRSVMYLDPGSVKRMEGDTVSARTKEVLVEPIMMGDETLFEVMSNTEFRCGKNQFRTMETTDSYKSGKTERIAAEGMRTWKTISKESTKKIYDHLCTRPQVIFQRLS